MVKLGRKLVLILFVILASGPTITLISGLYRWELSIPGRTNIGYGFPLSWHGQSGPVVYPEVPTVGWFSWESFVLDTVLWSLLVSVITAVGFSWFSARK